ncbi:MFS transporter [Variovorax sp. NFACC27]|uniref:MFS transporter n=1 Tax=unclassified Variovorax TaxID=663243 RepID=UPI0008946D37|nr:Predicted arabinose efflux permease, MFS family [Variovorax sp. NFACC28]SEG93939.1 Predicted arabinose efflux permease, MFS family [Variovorax sp. NFACC29]SFD58716.1 Predicted arabinose efflux permease, MFS family [Variovorax sp. NFACC26]SFG89035.1 Predicted arabinose efflux permease, MFS family [Variovorax sp. NFACC27]
MPSSCPELASATAEIAARSRPWRLPQRAAFPLLAAVLFAFFFAAAAPSPLFVVFQHAWHFSSSLLTVAFAVYAIALLVSLLIAGSLSDHIGRRPAALVLQAVAMGLFLLANGIGGLIAARVVQGIATGVASGALSAAVVEAAPAARKRLGAMITSVSPLAGLALGALLTGVAVKFSLQPVMLVFGVLAVVFALGAAVVLWMPETVTPRAGALASLVPRVSIPAQARAEFARGLPVFVVVWALGGLYLSLAPSLMLHVFGIDNGVVNGLTVAVLSGMGAIAPTLLARFAAPKPVILGMASIAAGLVLLLASLATRSLALFFVGTAVAGLGFGGAFSALVQTLAPMAQSHERGELFAAIFVVSYLAFSLPAMLAGFLVAPLGLLNTTEGYAAVLLLIAAFGVWNQWAGLRRRSRELPVSE